LPVALGFHKEGVMRKTLVVDDRAFDMVVYSLLANEHVAADARRIAHGSHDRLKLEGLSEVTVSKFTKAG
jgi:hypothetical protein